MKDQSQIYPSIEQDEKGCYIIQGGKKNYLKDVEKKSNWLTSQEVNKIIELYYKKEPVEVPPDTQDEQIKLFIELFPNQYISLSTLTLDNTNYKFYIFTDGAFFGYAFLINDKFAHIDYTPKKLSDFITDDNKFNISNLPLQNNTIEHNGSCGLGTATDICEIIKKINNKTDNSQILQWLKSKTPNQERKLTVREQEFSTNVWNLNIKNNLAELLYQDPEPTIDIIAQSQKDEGLPINNNKSAQDINNEIIENLKAHYIQLFKEDGEIIFNEIKEANNTTADKNKTTETTENKIERLCTFISSIVKQQKDIEKELKEKSNNQIIIKSNNRLLDYQGFEVVICDKKSTTIERQKPKIFDSVIPDIKKDIDYAFCQKNNTNNFGFRFNSEAGELINAVNKEGASDEAKNTAWKKLLTEHDTVIFKLALDKQNYIRFYLNRDKDGKIEFASDEFLFSKEDAVKLSQDFAEYDEIKKRSKLKISDNERFDIHLYCKSGEKENDKDKEILKAEFNAQKPQNKITNTRIENQSLKKSQII
jgi:hypothetical protein